MKPPLKRHSHKSHFDLLTFQFYFTVQPFHLPAYRTTEKLFTWPQQHNPFWRTSKYQITASRIFQTSPPKIVAIILTPKKLSQPFVIHPVVIHLVIILQTVISSNSPPTKFQKPHAPKLFQSTKSTQTNLALAYFLIKKRKVSLKNLA